MAYRLHHALGVGRALSGPRLQAADIPEGTRIDGRYIVRGVLGRGGMGVVYDAMQEVVRRPVALKVLGPAWAQDEAATKRFELEATVAARVGFPYVPAVYDFGHLPDGRPFIAMEHLTGESLAELCHERHASIEETAELVELAATALDALHAHDVIHRDVKPANLFLEPIPDGRRIRVLDLGLVSTALFAGGRLTQEGVAYGTPHYMAPEMNEGAPPGKLADVYSLGVVAYQLLCGEVPFDSPNPIRIFNEKLRRDAPTIAERTGQKLPVEIEDVLARALSRDPSRRPQGCSELARELSAAAGISAHPSVVALKMVRV